MGRVLPILFNMAMVRAIVDGRKTSTRRIVKQATWENFVCEGGKVDGYFDKRKEDLVDPINKAPYQQGDILYVRETWTFLPCVECMQDDDGKCMCNKEPAIHEDQYSVSEGCFVYRADCLKEDSGSIVWSPSIHMPKQAARIWLKVTDVSVERLKDIDTLGCQREGIDISRGGVFKRFSELWDSTIPKAKIDRYGWRANPWVWVIRFERCGKPEGQ